MSTADILYQEGLRLFAQEEFSAAVQRYLSAIWHLDFSVASQWEMEQMGKLGMKSQEDLNKRKLIVVNSITIAYMKMEDWVNLEKSTDIGLRHIKLANIVNKDLQTTLLYRMGVAYLEGGYPRIAIEAFKGVASMGP